MGQAPSAVMAYIFTSIVCVSKRSFASRLKAGRQNSASRSIPSNQSDRADEACPRGLILRRRTRRQVYAVCASLTAVRRLEGPHPEEARSAVSKDGRWL